MVFGRKKKDDKEDEFQENLALSEQQRVAPEYLDQIGRLQTMLKDEVMTYVLTRDPLLRKAYAARSHLNRTSKYNQQDKEIQLLQLQGLNLLFMMHMDEEDYEKGGALLAEALDIYDYNQVCDNFEGWKPRVCTEFVKRIETRTEKKKGRWPF